MKHIGVVAKVLGLLILLSVVLSGTLLTLSYQQQRALYFDKLEITEQMASAQVKLLSDQVEGAEKSIKRDSQAYISNPDARKLQAQMDHLVTGQLVSNAYLFFPEEIDKDGKLALPILIGNQELYGNGITPTSPYELSPEMREAYEEAKKGGQGTSDVYTDVGGSWVSVLSAIPDKEGNVTAYFGLDFDYRAIRMDLNRTLWKSVGIGTGLSLIFLAVFALLVRQLLKPIKAIAELSKRVAEGDLNVSVQTKSRDELGVLAFSFNAMIARIRELIGGMQTSSERVTAASISLKESAQQTAQATEQIAQSIQEVASGAELQQSGTYESTRAMEEMASGIQRIAESAASASDASAQMAGEAGRGRDALAGNQAQMEAVQGAVRRTSDAVERLHTLSEQIGKITSLISDIAGQTNILSLNAAIEASRAGEHGRGFAVVSTEIRHLAEQSLSSSQQIAELIETIQRETAAAVEAMQAGSQGVDGMAVLVRETVESFEHIAMSIDSINAQFFEVSSSAQQMSASAEEVSATIAELSGISRRSSEHAQNVAAASEEQLAAMEEISSSATALAGMSDQLRGMIGKFRL
ncbi:hypothetical protein J31TS4_17570 [Paenibacillus sp. J31TS4]|uniref:methyl-accepting chemotaxis protein n=1 Tax=Paenibacillus sp. J31TS4 TaxID=2807195 RepID=UPI001B13A4CC|nr:methyl-accepting chemotaxis protein [Paenibacillus sp. J31TS4]GIP38477.1 hypothetical protein J31TS4_17570 [Paenibacillus sp. J31TS4]